MRVEWVNRHHEFGELGLQDRPWVPHARPTTTPPQVVARIEQLRRDRKWLARRIREELAGEDHRQQRPALEQLDRPGSMASAAT